MHSADLKQTDQDQSLWDQYHYKAFISYSREDRVAGSQVQKQLELFKVPKALRGRETANGPIPARIAPVFRDLSDLDAHGSLTENIETVLSRSAFLIVLCSPSAAKSHWVNKEIETFCELGGADRIVPILVEGHPHEFNDASSPEGAFPPALIHAATRKGGGNPTAPDMRPKAEGIDFTILKTAAAIIGISPEILSQRVAERERRDKRMQRRIAGIMTGLTAVAIATSFIAFDKLFESEARRSVALAGRATQSFAGRKYDQAMITATAALPDHQALIHAPSTPPAEYAFRRAAYFNRLIARFDEHQANFRQDNRIRAVAVSPDGKLVASGDQHGGVKLWSTDSAQSETTLEGHICGDISKQQEQCEVTDIAFSPDGKLFASASYDDTIRVWATDEQKLLHLIDGHESMRKAPTEDGLRFSTMIDGRVNAIDFSADNAWLASASWDGTARVWDMATGEEAAFFEHGGTELYDVQFSPDGAFMATAAGDFAGVWDRTANALLVSFEMPNEADAIEVAFSPSGGHVAVAYTTGDAIIYDAATGARIIEAKIEGPAYLVRYSKDGKRLFFGGDGTTMSVIDTSSGEEVWQAPTMDTQITAASFILESRFGSDMLATAGTNGMISIHDISSGHEEAKWRAGNARIIRAAFANDGEILVTADDDAVAAVWNSNFLNQNRRLASVEYRHLAFSPSGDEALVINDQGGIQRFDIESGALNGEAVATSDITALSHINNDTALVARRNNNIDIIDLQTGATTRNLLSNIEMRIWSQEGVSRWKHDAGRNIFAAVSDDRRILIVTPQSEAPPFFLVQKEDEKVCRLAIDRAGKRIAALTHRGQIKLFDANDFSLVAQEIFEPNGVQRDCENDSFIVISADSKTIAAGVNERIGVWRTKDGKKIRDIASSYGKVQALALSEDGRMLYFSSERRAADFYQIDLSKNEAAHVIAANSAGIKKLNVSDNGSILTSAGFNWSIGIWDAATGGFYSSMVLENRPTSVLFNAERNLALVGLGYKSVYLIDMPLSQSGVELSAMACAKLPVNRGFTDDELNDPFLSGLLTPAEKRICH